MVLLCTEVIPEDGLLLVGSDADPVLVAVSEMRYVSLEKEGLVVERKLPQRVISKNVSTLSGSTVPLDGFLLVAIHPYSILVAESKGVCELYDEQQ